MRKTRIKLKKLESYVDLYSNVFTLFITYSVHGRRDYNTVSELCHEQLGKTFPPITRADITVLGWADPKYHTIRCTVKLLLADRPVYKVHDSWRG
jgi:hypothetical protein